MSGFALAFVAGTIGFLALEGAVLVWVVRRLDEMEDRWQTNMKHWSNASRH